MTKNLTCIVCPLGCSLEVELDGKKYIMDVGMGQAAPKYPLILEENLVQEQATELIDAPVTDQVQAPVSEPESQNPTADAPVQAPVEAPEQQAAEMIKITFSRKLSKALCALCS